jgi:hypothetical protein
MDERQSEFLSFLCSFDNDTFVFVQDDTITIQNIDMSLEEEDYAWIQFQKQRYENLFEGKGSCPLKVLIINKEKK